MVAMAMPLSFFSWVNYVFTFVHLADAFKSSATSIAFKLCITWELNPSFTVLGKIKEHVFSSVPLLFQILPIMRTVQKCKWGCCPVLHWQAMRKGLLDVLPKNALEDLTAEDFRLLVNGCGEVNVQMLISFTSFNDESGTFHDLLNAWNWYIFIIRTWIQNEWKLYSSCRNCLIFLNSN